jgi:small subunit ribosomal protein S9
MAEDERDRDAPEASEEQPQPDETPPAAAPAEEAPSAEEPAEEAPSTGEEPAAEEPAERTPAERERQEETPSAEESAEQEQAQAPPERPAEREERPEGQREEPPGAELEPIAIEEEGELGAEERARREAEAEERARREAEATAEAGEEPAPSREPTVTLEGDVRVQATGKRKSSVARVVLLPGSGRFEVNTRELDQYFPRPFHRTMARQPLVTTGYEGNVDVRVRVHGGGVSGQAGAVRHGVARALCEVDPELRRELKRRGLLTRDARRKERRKAGLKKARKRPQFSKR